MELAWVGLNYLGIERTETAATVRSVSDIHLAYMPYSHSVATAIGGALLAWVVLEKGLYAHVPMSAFVLELFYGVFCWWVYRGSGILLAVIVVGNLANLSLLSATIAGPEQYLAGHPMIVVTVIFAQIVAMLVLVGVLSSRPPTR